MEQIDKRKWNVIKISLFAISLVGMSFAGLFLYNVYTENGSEKFINSLILVSAMVIGIAHILLFVVRRLFETKNSPEAKKLKRKLESYRRVINYITPFVLIAMGIHFWQKNWILACIVTGVLLLDRMNDLLRKNK